MGEACIFLLFTMLLGGGSGNELLDLIPTDAYWKSKAIEITAPNIMLELNSIKVDDTSKEMRRRGRGHRRAARATQQHPHLRRGNDRQYPCRWRDHRLVR